MRFIQKKLINYLVRKLAYGVTKDDLLRIEPRSGGETIVFFAGRQLDIKQVQELKDECERFSNSFFWKVICDRRIRYEAQKKGFEAAQVDGDMWIAKGTIYALDIIKQIIKEIEAI